MKKSLLFFLLIATLGSCISCAASINKKINTEIVNNHKNVSEHVLKSTVTLIDPKEGPYCSGFFISPTKIVTARHCIDKDNIFSMPEMQEFDKMIIEMAYKSQDIYLMKYSKTNSQLENIKVNTARVIYISKEKRPTDRLDIEDIAILEVPEKNKSFNWLKLRNNKPYHGEELVIYGTPYGIPWTLTFGNVARIEYGPSGNYLGFLANSTIIAGSSGAPVVNNKGECIGMVSSVLDVNAQFEKPDAHIPEGELGLIIGVPIIQDHLQKYKTN